ncbi:MAG: rhodanese-like domain-containing protein [Rhodospirillaceae bacterium]
MNYAGDVSVEDAWRILGEDSSAQLIDVRTAAEWNFVGLPNLDDVGKPVHRVEWQGFPGGAPNPQFTDQVTATGDQPDDTLLFLCRSGGRSKAAAIAMTERGYSKCYNVAGGFEGDLDGDRHRGRAGGWKAAGLPWNQS